MINLLAKPRLTNRGGDEGAKHETDQFLRNDSGDSPSNVLLTCF